MSKKSPELLNLVLELNSKWLKSKQIAEEIKKQLWVEVSDRSVRLWLKQEIDTELTKVRKLKDEIEYTNPFEFEWDNIVFYYKDETWTKRISIPIDEVRHIWEDYSKHWTNLTWQQIIVKYELNPKVWQLIKNRLQLYKDSDIIPDWLLEKINKEQWEEAVEELIEEVSHKAVFNKYNNILVWKYNRIKESEYKRAITQLYNIENFLEMLRWFIDNYEPEKFIDYNKISNTHNKNVERHINNTLYTTITDIHIGKEWTNKIIERLKIFTQDIINRPEKNIKLFILWDLVESVIIWWKHPNVAEHMDWPYWFDLIMKSVWVLEDVITNIYKSGKNIEVHWIFWNHDSYDKIDNLDWTAWLTIYELIKRWISNLWITLNYYKDIWKTINTEDFCFILNHWTWPHTKKKAQDILWEYWDNKKENIILQGDKHHLEINNVSKNWTRVLVASMAGAWQYDTKLWLTSMTWYTVIKKWYNWKPNIENVFID